ncbi:MAG: hypothetical protein ACYC5Y_13270 [Symbiobacteriia bacterium]
MEGDTWRCRIYMVAYLEVQERNDVGTPVRLTTGEFEGEAIVITADREQAIRLAEGWVNVPGSDKSAGITITQRASIPAFENAARN